ncbi:MAG: hypothetical protein GPOALKHO_001697 [Sodalis sp.]|nr:MAG: hypothetical protein GPOALKHO_001697 [Sodalis sp.]
MAAGASAQLCLLPIKERVYHGAIARQIVAEVRRRGDLINCQDLANYQALERRAVMANYRDYEIYYMYR